jgi:predicted Zn-dependent peptidase
MKYRRQTLDNGLTIVTTPIKSANIVCVGFFVSAGSSDETSDIAGIAHLLEHMLFRGTTSRSSEKMLKTLDSMAADYNAATTHQYTYYYICSEPKNIKTILDIIMDMYVNPIFNRTKLEKEKKVVAEELKTTSDKLDYQMHTALYKQMFKRTSLAREITGTPQSIQNITRSDLVEFWDTYYQPHNTVFVVSGNFNPTPIVNMMTKILAPLENHAHIKHKNLCNQITKNIDSQSEPFVKINVDKSRKQAYVALSFCMGEDILQYNTQISFLGKILSLGMDSRLSKALRGKRGLVYNVSAYQIVYDGCGVFIIQYAVDTKELVNSITVVLKELAKLKRQEITKDERLKVVTSIKLSSQEDATDPVSIMISNGLNVLYNPNADVVNDKDTTYLSKVTRKSIQEAAKQLFLRDKINLFVNGNVTNTKFDFSAL